MGGQFIVHPLPPPGLPPHPILFPGEGGGGGEGQIFHARRTLISVSRDEQPRLRETARRAAPRRWESLTCPATSPPEPLPVRTAIHLTASIGQHAGRRPAHFSENLDARTSARNLPTRHRHR